MKRLFMLFFVFAEKFYRELRFLHSIHECIIFQLTDFTVIKQMHFLPASQEQKLANNAIKYTKKKRVIFRCCVLFSL